MILFGAQNNSLPTIIQSPADCHFTAPSVRPVIKWRCIKKKIKTGGTAAKRLAAETKCQLFTNWPFNARTPAVMGLTCSPWVKTLAQKKSFQTKVKINTDRAANAGRTNGSITNQNISPFCNALNTCNFNQVKWKGFNKVSHE